MFVNWNWIGGKLPRPLLLAAALVLLAPPLALAAGPAGAKGAAAAGKLPAGVVSETVTILRKINVFRETPRGEVGPREDEPVDRNVGFIDVDDRFSPRYRFDGTVKVLDEKGREIAMSALRLPCKARVYFYKNRDQAPVLYSIEVISVSPGARNAWTEDYRDIRPR